MTKQPYLTFASLIHRGNRTRSVRTPSQRKQLFASHETEWSLFHLPASLRTACPQRQAPGYSRGSSNFHTSRFILIRLDPSRPNTNQHAGLATTLPPHFPPSGVNWACCLRLDATERAGLQDGWFARAGLAQAEVHARQQCVRARRVQTHHTLAKQAVGPADLSLPSPPPPTGGLPLAKGGFFAHHAGFGAGGVDSSGEELPLRLEEGGEVRWLVRLACLVQHVGHSTRGWRQGWGKEGFRSACVLRVVVWEGCFVVVWW